MGIWFFFIIETDFNGILIQLQLKLYLNYTLSLETLKILLAMC